MPQPTHDPTDGLVRPLSQLKPKGQQPKSVAILNQWIAHAERSLGVPAAGGRMGWLVASTVVIAALQQAVDHTGTPSFLLKGGTMLQHRLGLTARATSDIDGLIRGDIARVVVESDDEPGDVTPDEPVDVAGGASGQAEAMLQHRPALEQEARSAGVVNGLLQGCDHHRRRDEPPHAPTGGGNTERALRMRDPLVQDRHALGLLALRLQLRQGTDEPIRGVMGWLGHHEPPGRRSTGSGRRGGPRRCASRGPAPGAAGTWASRTRCTARS